MSTLNNTNINTNIFGYSVGTSRTFRYNSIDHVHNSVSNNSHIYPFRMIPEQQPSGHVNMNYTGTSIGNSLIRHVEVDIGNEQNSQHYGEWLELWNNLTTSNNSENIIENIEKNITCIEKSEIEYECSICLNNITEDIAKTECEHYFCKSCIIKWLKKNNTCPNCRTSFQYYEK